MMHIRGDLVFRVVLTHEMDRVPVVVGEFDVLRAGEFPGDVFVPVEACGEFLIPFLTGVPDRLQRFEDLFGQ